MAEKDNLLGHADDNDGIDEYDNALPKWWVWLFFFTILWGIGYAIDYHFISMRSQAAAYDAEVAQAEARWPQPEVTSVAITPELIAQGKEIYGTNCIGCHGSNLKGLVGPNLIDETWIHGGSLKEITATINDGVPDKGMLAWGPILGPQKISAVAAYVYQAGKDTQ